jgi:hypothetical protein
MLGGLGRLPSRCNRRAPRVVGREVYRYLKPLTSLSS